LADLKLVPASKLPKRTVDVLGEKCTAVPLTKHRIAKLEALDEQIGKAEGEEEVLKLLGAQFDVLLDPPPGQRIIDAYDGDDLTITQLRDFAAGLLEADAPN